MPLVNYFHVTWKNNADKTLQITCKHFNRYVKLSSKSGELIYTTFLHTGMVSLGLYPEEIDPDNIFFQWKSG